VFCWPEEKRDMRRSLIIDWVTDHFGIQGGIFLILGVAVWVVLMNLWRLRVIKSTRLGTAARKRGMTAYLIGVFGTLLTAMTVPVLLLRGWSAEVLWNLLPTLVGAAIAFYRYKRRKATW
jgi:hypothetical protein